MIIFRFDYETHESDGTLKPRATWWNTLTECVGDDEEHADEIYEQLMSEQIFL